MTKLSISVHPGSYLKNIKFLWILQWAQWGHLHNMQNWNFPKLLHVSRNFLNLSELGKKMRKLSISAHPVTHLKNIKFSLILQRAQWGHLHNMHNWNFPKLFHVSRNYLNLSELGKKNWSKMSQFGEISILHVMQMTSVSSLQDTWKFNIFQIRSWMDWNA